MGRNLRCDAPGCGHVEEIDFDESSIGMPCPKCGANLLTREDYEWFVANVQPMVDLGLRLGWIKETQGSAGDLRINNHEGRLKVDLDIE